VRTSTSRGNSPDNATVSRSDVARFEKVVGQTAALRDEFAVLSKSKPDNPLNKFKVQLVNERLAEANEVLTGTFKPIASFTVFEGEQLPTNSDVVVVLTQYLACLERWRSTHVDYNEIRYRWYWRTTDGELEAAPATQSKG